MDRKSVYKFGVKSGLLIKGDDFGFRFDQLMEFAELVATDEREACAKVCLEEAPSLDGQLCAEAIRARGQE